MELISGASHVYLADGQRACVVEIHPDGYVDVQVILHGNTAPLMRGLRVITSGSPGADECLLTNDPFQPEVQEEPGFWSSLWKRFRS